MNKPLEPVTMETLSPLITGCLEQGMEVTLTVTGRSMFPMLVDKRDSVVLTACQPLALRRGDIALYRRKNGQYVLHRIFHVDADSYTFVGDGQTEKETGVPKTAVMAVVKGFTRKGVYTDVGNRKYQLYVTIWRWLRPVRGVLITGYRQLRGQRKHQKDKAG